MTTTNIEQYIIEQVKKKRIESGFSQADLAFSMNLSVGFIGKVESTKYNSKYNLNHINQLSKIFKCSPKYFLPDNYLE
jgi:transcriptional regulator with XRE-family HTH domain